MTAGRGIIHSEMPRQESGRMRGFQLWVNLPARKKKKPAGYRDIQPEEMPLLNQPGGGQVKIIAGTAKIDGKTIPGPIQGISTEPLFLDVRLPADGHFSHPINTEYNAFVYSYEGHIEIGPVAERRLLGPQSAGVLSTGHRIEIHAVDEGVAFLLLAARPLREPVVQYGPFVMNTREEIEQAITGYKNGQWQEVWFDTETTAGEFVRTQSAFRNRLTADGTSLYQAESRRYHLYVPLACPWAHRTLIVRALKKLEEAIPASIIEPVMSDQS